MMAHNPAPVTAFVFPGVGVKLSAYEAGFIRHAAPLFTPFFDTASERAGIDLVEALETNALGHRDRRVEHFFTYAFSCAMVDWCREQGIEPDLLAGYSFGIYASLYATGALCYADGLAAVARAYDLMATACEGRDYSMAITVGLSAGEIDAILSSHYYDQLCMVNSNNDTCKVFAGPRHSLRTFIDEALRHEALDARFLPVDIPYHHPRLLDGVQGAFHAFLTTLRWQPPLRPLISSIDQGLLTTADELCHNTARNLNTPINWERVAAALHGRRVTRAVECGPGISLTQNGRFMPFHIDYLNVKNLRRKLGVR